MTKTADFYNFISYVKIMIAIHNIATVAIIKYYLSNIPFVAKYCVFILLYFNYFTD